MASMSFRRPLSTCVALAICIIVLLTTSRGLQPPTRWMFGEGRVSPLPPSRLRPQGSDVGSSSDTSSSNSNAKTTPSRPDGGHAAAAPHSSSLETSGSAPSSAPAAAAATSSNPPAAAAADADPQCAGFPDLSNVMTIMKTGASESFDKIPTQLQTTLRCLPKNSFAVFSDLAQTIGGVPVNDALVNVIPKVREESNEFKIYRTQRACPVDVELCLKQSDLDVGGAGWTLDKYKNNHMAVKVWDAWPRHDWYFFIDADTFVFWGGLARFLEDLNPAHHHYIGAKTWLGSETFSHGGSGYLISRHTMEAHAKGWPAIAAEFDQRAASICCGDFLHGDAIRKIVGIENEQGWPSFVNEKYYTLTFYQHMWCHPLVTLHHLSAESVSNLWTFEKNRSSSSSSSNSLPAHPSSGASPAASWSSGERERKARNDKPGQQPIVLAKDIYHAFVAPQLRSRLDNWDNGADDLVFLDPQQDSATEHEKSRARADKDKKTDAERAAHTSFNACAHACAEAPGGECLQFRYRQGVCAFKNTIRLGEPAKTESDPAKMLSSGWDLHKIEQWVTSQDQADCAKVWWAEISP